MKRIPLTYDVLAPKLKESMSFKEIADELGWSRAHVSRISNKLGLHSNFTPRVYRSEELDDHALLVCAKHGESVHTRSSGKNGHRCLACIREYQEKKRRTNKKILVEESGGGCKICGYNRCLDALDFHHRTPSEKEYTISNNLQKSTENLRKEAAKCDLLCCRCHAELHAKEGGIGRPRIEIK